MNESNFQHQSFNPKNCFHLTYFTYNWRTLNLKCWHCNIIPHSMRKILRLSSFDSPFLTWSLAIIERKKNDVIECENLLTGKSQSVSQWQHIRIFNTVSSHSHIILIYTLRTTKLIAYELDKKYRKIFFCGCLKEKFKEHEEKNLNSSFDTHQ